MRKLNLEATAMNVDNMSFANLYSFYGLTENSDFDISQDNYVTEHFRFSCSGTKDEISKKIRLFTHIISTMHKAYLKEMNLSAPLFHISMINAKATPYKTIVIDIEVENVKGAFVTVINCAGPDKHQFHASDLWVRANTTADVWKSLFDHKEEDTTTQTEPFEWINKNESEKWLCKVKDARNVAKDCIKTAGEPSIDEKNKLITIMKR